MTAKFRYGCVVALLLTLGTIGIAFGQTRPEGNDGPGRGQRGQGRFDPTQMRQRMLDRMKEELGATDEEFKALQPKIEHVLQLQREANAGRFMGMMGRRGGPGGGPGGGGPGGGPGGPGGPGADVNQTPSPIAQKAKDLQDTLENKDAPAGDIKAKLDALREARAKSKEEVTKAQQELREVLTQRQEAALVVSGILD